MAERRRKNAEATKRSILEAAGRLFASRGYDAVTMREIAKAAGCSHTTIYLYFKDKLDLLQQMAIPPLQQLEAEFAGIMGQAQLSPLETLQALSRAFVVFCFTHKSLFFIFLGTKAGRVDEAEPELAVNRLRNRLFGHLLQAWRNNLPALSENEALNTARIYFYTLHGLIRTYMDSEEPLEGLLERVLPILDEAAELLLNGVRAKKCEAKGEPA